MVGSKAEIRAEMRKRRAALTEAERAAAAGRVCGVLEKEAGGVVAVYLASPREIDLTAFIRTALARGTVLAAPRWTGEAYALARLRGLGGAALRKGPMGILEPAEDDPVDPRDVDVWVVPGLAFARDGARLGYGGGWYDRLLADAKPGAEVWGVAHGFQIVESLPREPHDVKVGRIIV